MRLAHRVAWSLSLVAAACIFTAIWLTEVDIDLLLKVGIGCCIASSLASLVLFAVTRAQTGRWRGALLWPLLIGGGSYLIFFGYALLTVGRLLAIYAD